MTETAIIDLSFTRPPLNLNQRLHWAQKAELTRDIRQEVCIKTRPLKAAFAPGPIIVSLHWQPKDNRRRDSDNPVLTAKACFDGIVDAGLVPDDTPEHMVKLMPIIHPAIKGEPAKCWLEIRKGTVAEIAA